MFVYLLYVSPFLIPRKSHSTIQIKINKKSKSRKVSSNEHLNRLYFKLVTSCRIAIKLSQTPDKMQQTTTKKSLKNCQTTRQTFNRLKAKIYYNSFSISSILYFVFIFFYHKQHNINFNVF